MNPERFTMPDAPACDPGTPRPEDVGEGGRVRSAP